MWATAHCSQGREGGLCGGGGILDLDLDVDWGPNLKAHRTPGVEHDGVPSNSAYWPAIPYEMG